MLNIYLIKCPYRADVERLIGEGAVRTVKKPTHMKKRLLTTQSSVLLQKEDFEEMVEQAQVNMNNDITAHDMSIGSDNRINQQENYGTKYDCKTDSHQTYSDSPTVTSTSTDVIYSAAENKRSDIATYLFMNDCPMDVGMYKIKNKFFRTYTCVDIFILFYDIYMRFLKSLYLL